MPLDGQMSKTIRRIIFIGQRWIDSKVSISTPSLSLSLSSLNRRWRRITKKCRILWVWREKSVFVLTFLWKSTDGIFQYIQILFSVWNGDRCIVAFLYESVANTINYTYLGSYILKLNRTFTCLPFFSLLLAFLSLTPIVHFVSLFCISGIRMPFAVWFVVFRIGSNPHTHRKSPDQKDDEFLKASKHT